MKRIGKVLGLSNAAFSVILLTIVVSTGYAHCASMTQANLSRAGGIVPDTVIYDSVIQSMVDSVTDSAISRFIGYLSGEDSVEIGGEPYLILTRHTSSGEPVQKATQYVHEYLEALGYTTNYFDWNAGGSLGRNVVGEKTGSVFPEKIIVLIAHIDDMPTGSSAPGADDNASGCSAILAAAQSISSYGFEYTIRFVLVTGHEQGLLGSAEYADMSSASGEDIAAVINLFMIGWDDLGQPVMQLHINQPSSPLYPGDSAIAELVVDVIGTYHLDTCISPEIVPDGIAACDIQSFWNLGYRGLVYSEDLTDDFNPYFHTASDALDRLNLRYCTANAQAATASLAHLAVLTDPTTTRPTRNPAHTLPDVFGVTVSTKGEITAVAQGTEMITGLNLYSSTGRIISRYAGPADREIRNPFPEKMTGGLYVLEMVCGCKRRYGKVFISR